MHLALAWLIENGYVVTGSEMRSITSRWTGEAKQSWPKQSGKENGTRQGLSISGGGPRRRTRVRDKGTKTLALFLASFGRTKVEAPIAVETMGHRRCRDSHPKANRITGEG